MQKNVRAFVCSCLLQGLQICTADKFIHIEDLDLSPIQQDDLIVVQLCKEACSCFPDSAGDAGNFLAFQIGVDRGLIIFIPINFLQNKGYC